MHIKLKSVVTMTLLITVLITGSYWGWDWWNRARFEIRSDDAYVVGDITAISARVAGHVIELLVNDNQPVEAGQVLLRLNDRHYQAAFDQAQAAVAQAQAALINLTAERHIQIALQQQAAANSTEVAAHLELAKTTFRRTSDLATTQAIAVASVDETYSQRMQLEAKLQSAHAAEEVVARQLDHLDSRREMKIAQLVAAKAALASAQFDLESTVVRAPSAGIVGNRGAQIGRFVGIGARLLDIVATQSLWVEVNLRETQIEKIVPGLPVRLTVDGFPNQIITGLVDSMSPGSGAVFSLIRPDNATGNFVRIVQRVPVKIQLNAIPDSVRLVPGLSARVAITTTSPPVVSSYE